jgi:type II secretory pathway component GspD/PulD (secretin)
MTVLAASSAFAQEEKKAEAPKPQNFVQRIVQVQHASPDRLRSLLEIFGIQIKSDHNLKTIALSGPAESVKAAEDAIRRLDVPPVSRNIKSTFYMIMASQKAEGDGKLPGELDSVIKQLKTISAYQNYRLLDTIVLRSREGNQADTAGTLPSPVKVAETPQSGTYRLSFNSVSVDPDTKNGHLVHFNNLNFVARMPLSTGPNQFQFHENRIATSVDVREGQKVVLGKANVELGDSALILVVTAKVVD